jgi:hypothetical protein
MNRKTAAPRAKRDALLAEMSSLSGLLNGSLVQRYSTCSRENCACHSGRRHGPRLYLAVTGEGGQRQSYVPAACAARAAEGVAQGRRLRAIVREVTALNLRLLREPPEAGPHE